MSVSKELYVRVQTLAFCRTLLHWRIALVNSYGLVKIESVCRQRKKICLKFCGLPKRYEKCRDQLWACSVFIREIDAQTLQWWTMNMKPFWTNRIPVSMTTVQSHAWKSTWIYSLIKMYQTENFSLSILFLYSLVCNLTDKHYSSCR